MTVKIQIDPARGAVSTVRLPAALEAVRVQIPGADQEHVASAIELLTALLSERTDLPQFIDRAEAVDALIVLALCSQALSELIAVPNVALAGVR